MNCTVERLAIVLSGGGERVGPWQAGVLAGMAEAGLDVRRAGALLGTSAGSLAAARLALGEDPCADARVFDAGPPVEIPDVIRRAVSEALLPLVAIWTQSDADEQERRRRVGTFALNRKPAVPSELHLARNAARVPEGQWPSTLRFPAIDADSGERVALGSDDGATVAEGVAAARALPGLVAPVRIGARRYIDGAIGSATNADLIPEGVDCAIVITAAPACTTAGTVDRMWNAALAAEKATLEARGIESTIVHASPKARAAMGEDMMSLAGAREAVAEGRRQGRATAESLGGDLLRRAA